MDNLITDAIEHCIKEQAYNITSEIAKVLLDGTESLLLLEDGSNVMTAYHLTNGMLECFTLKDEYKWVRTNHKNIEELLSTGIKSHILLKRITDYEDTGTAIKLSNLNMSAEDSLRFYINADKTIAVILNDNITFLPFLVSNRRIRTCHNFTTIPNDNTGYITYLTDLPLETDFQKIQYRLLTHALIDVTKVPEDIFIARLKELFKTFKHRYSETIFFSYYGLDGNKGKTFTEIAKALNLSSSRISQILYKTRRMLWHPSRLIPLTEDYMSNEIILKQYDEQKQQCIKDYNEIKSGFTEYDRDRKVLVLNRIFNNLLNGHIVVCKIPDRILALDPKNSDVNVYMLDENNMKWVIVDVNYFYKLLTYPILATDAFYSLKSINLTVGKTLNGGSILNFIHTYFKEKHVVIKEGNDWLLLDNVSKIIRNVNQLGYCLNPHKVYHFLDNVRLKSADSYRYELMHRGVNMFGMCYSALFNYLKQLIYNYHDTQSLSIFISYFPIFGDSRRTISHIALQCNMHPHQVEQLLDQIIFNIKPRFNITSITEIDNLLGSYITDTAKQFTEDKEEQPVEDVLDTDPIKTMKTMCYYLKCLAGL